MLMTSDRYKFCATRRSQDETKEKLHHEREVYFKFILLNKLKCASPLCCVLVAYLQVYYVKSQHVNSFEELSLVDEASKRGRGGKI